MLLEKELNRLQNQAMDTESNTGARDRLMRWTAQASGVAAGADLRRVRRQARGLARPDPPDSVSDVESQLSDLEDEEAIQRMIANGTIFDELAKFKLRLAELTALNERLRNNGTVPPVRPRPHPLSPPPHSPSLRRRRRRSSLHTAHEDASLMRGVHVSMCALWRPRLRSR